MLVILDDVWKFVGINHIGLSLTSNEGVDFKLLLTSRDRHVCIETRVEVNSIVNVNVLTDVEGQSLFRQFAKCSDEDSIASRCQGLPIAIKTIASILQGRSKRAWNDALSKISYDNFQDEKTKSIFFSLCPEDFDIHTEELVRYGWGLKLFKEMNTILDAGNRPNTCTGRPSKTIFLIGSNYGGCVKMHDLVRAFVLFMFSEDGHASIVNHGSMLRTWLEENDMMKASCKRISLTCTG